MTATFKGRDKNGLTNTVAEAHLPVVSTKPISPESSHKQAKYRYAEQTLIKFELQGGRTQNFA